jgi:hypothetical protein
MDIQELTELIKTLRKDATTSGIEVGTGLNFYLLEPQAKQIYPVFYPLLASIPRVPPTLAGTLAGGDGVHWKAITGIDSDGYPATSEGNRNAVMNLTEKDYFAAFKYLGKETEVTFPAQASGRGFEDNVGLAQIALLNALLNDEERMILFGNSGSSGNGFQLGTAPTPTVAVAAGGSIPDGTYKVRVIALTGWGVHLASATGVKAPFTRTNADGSQDVLNGGTSAISAASANAVCGTGSNTINAEVVPVPGALGYAWYVGTAGDETFLKVTSGPKVTITALPPGTNQKFNATGLNTDNSANDLDFDGLLTWAFNYAPADSGQAVAGNSYWKDLGGANLNGAGDGTITEFEDALDFLWTQYKLSPDRIWVGGTLIRAVAAKILAAGVDKSVTRLTFDYSAAEKLVGGSFAVAYRSKYGPGQVKTLDVMTHPWMPEGVIYFELINNPYPAAGNAIPAVRRIVTLEDHFSIKWPYRRLKHEVGVYCFPTLENYIPFGAAVLTGVGNG